MRNGKAGLRTFEILQEIIYTYTKIEWDTLTHLRHSDGHCNSWGAGGVQICNIR